MHLLWCVIYGHSSANSCTETFIIQYQNINGPIDKIRKIMAFVLKSKNRWKPVAVDASSWGEIASQGFVCLEELTDYKIIKSRRSQLSKKDANVRVVLFSCIISPTAKPCV